MTMLPQWVISNEKVYPLLSTPLPKSAKYKQNTNPVRFQELPGMPALLVGRELQPLTEEKQPGAEWP